VAHAASLRLFATGGIGGVHRGTSGDVSADLTELAETPVAVVCSGAKSILDLPRTVEWLETGRVPVIGWNTSEFPAFFSRESGLPVSEQVSSTEEVAAILSAHWGIGSRTGVLICVPCPAAEAVARPRMEAAIEKAIGLADSLGVSGKELTPFLLARVAELTGDASLKANLALLKNNARVAAQISLALASHTGA
jgi:pseudouridine-5'-phosphate glycosidase